MKIGDPILKRVTETINIIEKQFNAVEIIDDFNLDKNDPFDLLMTIAKFLRSISDCDTSQIYMTINTEPELFFTTPKVMNPIAIKIDQTMKPDNKCLKIINQKKEQRALLILRVVSNYIPECLIILKETYFGRNNLKLHDTEFHTYLEYIAQKLSQKVDNYLRLKMLENHIKLSKRFLTSSNIQEPIICPGEIAKENIWTYILGATFDYMPLWGPLSMQYEPPRVQILKVQKGRQYLNLLAESEVINSEWRIGIRNLYLERNKTICGIYLDGEDKGENAKYLEVNPRNCLDRYASLMYADNEMPESELIIPVKDYHGNTIVLFNFEHILEKAFSKFHIKMLQQMVEDVKPFVFYSIYKYEQQIDIEKRLRYLMLRIVNKLTSTQQHKLKGDFGLLYSAIAEAENETKEGNSELVFKEIEKAKKFTSHIKQTSIDFSVNIQDYIQYGRRNIYDIINNSLPDVKKKTKLSGDNIDIHADEIPKDRFVFCSGMAQEHIHNILENAFDQFVSIRKQKDGLDFVGTIQVGYAEIDRSIEKANVHTYKLIQVSISDNGGGVPPGKEEWIFGINNSLKGEACGRGFGLYAAREYMKEIGGDLILENKYPYGAIFKIQFPEYKEALHEDMGELLNVKGGA